MAPGHAPWRSATSSGESRATRVPKATGLASKTRDYDYHGPGRGAGNSINALVDGWRLTGDRSYLEKCEQIIERSIHPNDDIPARRLLDAENRWSYTVHLQALGKYLDAKAEAAELDGAGEDVAVRTRKLVGHRHQRTVQRAVGVGPDPAAAGAVPAEDLAGKAVEDHLAHEAAPVPTAVDDDAFLNHADRFSGTLHQGLQLASVLAG